MHGEEQNRIGGGGKQEEGSCDRKVGFRIWAALVTQGRAGFKSAVYSRMAGVEGV